jgi:ABC-type siderophore export system fused ATPase/permease subunit
MPPINQTRVGRERDYQREYMREYRKILSNKELERERDRTRKYHMRIFKAKVRNIKQKATRINQLLKIAV